MEREYIRIKKPSSLPVNTNSLKKLDNEFWKGHVFFHILSFYKNFDRAALKSTIQVEQSKSRPRTEREIAKFLRLYLKNNRLFDLHFDISGEPTNDGEVEGNYDIVISNTYWKNKFFFECKNLNDCQDLVRKYVCYNTGNQNFDGGVYRYFNGKYAQHQNFGGMIGFVLSGDSVSIKTKIHEKLQEKFNTSPNGDLLRITDNSIEENDFTFDSHHSRFNSEFIIHHLLLNFS